MRAALRARTLTDCSICSSHRMTSSRRTGEAVMSRPRVCASGLVMLVALVVLASFWAPARAQSERSMHGASAGRDNAGMMLLLRGAHLTPEQDVKIQAILTARRAVSRALVEQLRQAQNGLTDKLFASGAVKESDLQPQLQQIAQLRDQLLRESAGVALEVRALLTPEQLSRVAQVKDRIRQLQNEMRQLWQSGKP